MAGEWIKVRTNLWNDPRVSQLCDLTGERKVAVIGALYWLWASADEHTQTGYMPGLSTKGIDRETNIAGMGSALLSIEWIEESPGGTTLVRFDEHNGASAKTRAQTAKRVANHKTNAQVTQEPENANAVSVTSALPREEKRREEKEVNQKKADTTDFKPVGEKGKTATGSRLPADWKPDQVDTEYCRTERPDLLPSKVAQNFYDYWIAKPGAAGRKLDWSATWRTWVRKESTDNAGRAAGARYPPPITPAEQNARNNAEAMRLLEGKAPTTDFDEQRTIDG